MIRNDLRETLRVKIAMTAPSDVKIDIPITKRTINGDLSFHKRFANTITRTRRIAGKKGKYFIIIIPEILEDTLLHSVLHSL